LDRMWNKYRDRIGVSTPETRTDYRRFGEPVYVPPGWHGRMPNGDSIESGATFVGIRSKYKNDPDWPKVDAYLRGGKAPIFTYHRMWGQSDIAIANASYGWLFPDDKSPSPAGAVLAGEAGGGAAAGGGSGKGGERTARHGTGRSHSSRSKKQK